VYEVSRRVWGLRLRRTEQGLALSPPFMLPSVHYKDVGLRIASFRSSIPTPPIPCLRFTVSLAVTAQDSGPSGSLVLSLKNFAFSGRVEDWRDAPRDHVGSFPVPASSNPSCRFPAMGLPAGFVARVMRPIRSVGLSTMKLILVEEPQLLVEPLSTPPVPSES